MTARDCVPSGRHPQREASTHRELVICPQHVLLLLARRVPADVADHKERGGQADGRAGQHTPPEGSIEHLFADHQGQSQEQSVCSVDKRSEFQGSFPTCPRLTVLLQEEPGSLSGPWKALSELLLSSFCLLTCHCHRIC